MAEEPGILEEFSSTQMIENVIGDFEPEGIDLAIVPPKASKEAEKMKLLSRKYQQIEAYNRHICPIMARRQACTR